MEIKNAVQALQAAKANDSQIKAVQNAWHELDEKNFYSEACALFYPTSGHLDIFTTQDARTYAILGQREVCPSAHIEDTSELCDLDINSFSTIESA